MSEATTAPAAESAPSAPQSTAEITSSVIREAESTASNDAAIEASREDQTRQAAGTPQAQEAVPAVVTPELSAAAKFLLSQGHREQNGRGGSTWLPFKTVEGMLERYFKESSKPWETEKTTISQQLKEAQDFREELLADLRGSDTKKFLERLSQYDPRYQSFLQPPPAAPVQQADPMPEPDLDFGDGRKTYSIDGIQKLMDWKTRQVEAKFEEKLKPLTEREQQSKERAAAEQGQQQLIEKTRAQIESAKAWPNWSEYEQDILKTLQEDSAKAEAEHRRPTMTLREAYLEVQAKYLAASDTEKRARWMEEANKAAKSTAVTRTGVEHTAKAGPRTIHDIAKATINELESRSA